MNIDSPERFEIGRVISRAFAVLSRNVATFIGLAAILTLPVLVMTLLTTRNAGVAALAKGSKLGAASPQFLLTVAGSAIVGMACNFVLQAALMKGTMDDLNGDRPGFGRSLSTGIQSLVPIIAIGLLAYLGLIVGFVLLVVPGIILLLSWSVVVPVRVVENTSITGSFGRSRALTKGCRWKILGLIAMYFLAAILLSLVIRPIFGVGLIRLGAAGVQLPFLITNWLVTVLEATVSAVGIASIYFELRFIKEGAAPTQLAAAFD